MDRHEVYLEFFRCVPSDVPAYVNHLCTPTQGARMGTTQGNLQTPFLNCQPYGPWGICNHTEMKRLMRIVIAITLIANLKIAKELQQEA